MEWVFIGGLVIWLVFAYMQVTRLEHQNSLLRQEIIELYHLLSHHHGITVTDQSPGCAWIMLLLLIVVAVIYVSLNG